MVRVKGLEEQQASGLLEDVSGVNCDISIIIVVVNVQHSNDRPRIRGKGKGGPTEPNTNDVAPGPGSAARSSEPVLVNRSCLVCT